MAGKRRRGNGSWEYVFKRSGVLDKPLYFTFRSEEEGDKFAAKLDRLLDRGIVPTQFLPAAPARTVGDLINEYCRVAHPSDKDRQVLDAVYNSIGKTPLAVIDARWVDAWITEMKQADRLAPGTIRAKIGALARCCDWGIRLGKLTMPDRPFRTLPAGYSQYTKTDAAIAGAKRIDTERDRRLEPGENEAVVRVLDAGVLPRKQRPLKLEHVPALRCLFVLAQESAMRLREMYTLQSRQVDLRRRTVFLEKTKNGLKRQVPLSTVALQALKDYGLPDEPDALLFPWWDGDTSTLHRTSDYLSNLWVQIFRAAGCDGLNFHDLRHEATCRLYERTTLSDLQIMKIVGHSSIRMLARYANLRGSDLAEQIW